MNLTLSKFVVISQDDRDMRISLKNLCHIAKIFSLKNGLMSYLFPFAFVFYKIWSSDLGQDLWLKNRLFMYIFSLFQMGATNWSYKPFFFLKFNHL